MKYRLILGSIFGTVLAGAGAYGLFGALWIGRDLQGRSEPSMGFFGMILGFGGVIALICAAAVFLWALGGMRRNKFARIVVSVIAFGAGIDSTIIGLVFASMLYQEISGYITHHHNEWFHFSIWPYAIFVGGTLFFFALARVFFLKAFRRKSEGMKGIAI